MDKFFVDTNIFTRFFLHDDSTLSPKAEKIITDCEEGKYTLVLAPVLFLEITWLLHSFYKQKKDSVIIILKKMLSFSNFEVLEKEFVTKMVSLYENSNIDLIDCYFVAQMQSKRIDQIFSFDHHFDKLPGIKRLEKIRI
ncbi:PIN domain-containing protein [Candidatus Gottesmanbacteria bacterium]|nr:PIN domain-containing protein [Candidatus Gottesmanbacteria bacterium]